MRRIAVTAGALVLACACASTHHDPIGARDAGVTTHVSATPEAAAPPPPAAFDAGFFEAGDAGACNVRLEMPPIMDSPHVPEGTVVMYDSNPPSSGPHYPIWADFREYATPVPDGYLVHSMEHGAVLLLYKCAAPCDELVASLRALRDAVPTDPLCDDAGAGERVRVILAPRPDNDSTIAAAAWGNTYHADCFDGASLATFIADHYAHAPENFCAPGQSTF